MGDRTEVVVKYLRVPVSHELCCIYPVTHACFLYESLASFLYWCLCSLVLLLEPIEQSHSHESAAAARNKESARGGDESSR